MPDLICLGEPLYELNQQADGSFLPGFGGDTSNCAIAAARQGASVGYLAHIGDDVFGQQFMKLWQTEGVDTDTVTLVPGGATGVYFVTHDDDGHHFSYRRTGSAASALVSTDLPQESIRQASILHVSGISQAISPGAADAVFDAIALARHHGVKVSYDTNLRTQLWPLARARAIIHQAMSACDIALPGLDDARQLTGLEQPQAIADFYLRLGADTVALTMGTNGTLVATAQGSRTISGYTVQAVDATAAGDTFDGAFLAEYLRNPDPFAAARYANAAAALSTLGYGAVAPMPRRAQVEQLLSGGSAPAC